MNRRALLVTVTLAAALAAALGIYMRGPVSDTAVSSTDSVSTTESAHESHAHSAEEAAAHGHREHADEEEEGAHEEHPAVSEDHDEDIVHLSPQELTEFGIGISTASSGTIEQFIDLPGEIVLNADRVAHVVPRVAGIAFKVFKSAGQQVKKGELLAIIESRELAEARAAYLAAVERENMAVANFRREARLWKKRITSQQEYLEARQALSEARIEKDSIEQQLHAIGLSETDIKTMTGKHDASGTRFEIRAPISGTIIDKHLTLGESVAADTNVFTIADLSTVWVDINVYQKDLGHVHKGQSVVIDAGHGIPPVTGTISWVSPRVDENTRTARARILLPNPDGKMRPGLFVTARVAAGQSSAPVVVPADAIQNLQGRTVIFIKTREGFKPVPVETGRQSGNRVEILSGLAPDQTYVSRGAFTLKAQLSRGAFGDGHNH